MITAVVFLIFVLIISLPRYQGNMIQQCAKRVLTSRWHNLDFCLYIAISYLFDTQTDVQTHFSCILIIFTIKVFITYIINRLWSQSKSSQSKGLMSSILKWNLYDLVFLQLFLDKSNWVWKFPYFVHLCISTCIHINEHTFQHFSKRLQL